MPLGHQRAAHQSREGPGMKAFLFRATALVGLAALAACNSSSGVTPFPPSASVHLYVSDDLASGHIYVFTLPVSAGSTPSATVAASTPGGMSLDATRLYVPNAGTTAVNAFTLPLSNASTPAFSMTLTNTAHDVTIGPSGNLYASEPLNNTCCIEALNAPLSGASTPAFSMTLASAGGFPWGATFDPSGNLIAAGASQAALFTPPFSGASTPAFHFGANSENYGIASDSLGRVFVANGPSFGKIDVYTPPYTNASIPTFAITVSANTLRYLAFDASGNLYVAVPTDNKVYVFTPPFSAASTPVFSIAVTNAYGVAIGP